MDRRIQDEGQRGMTLRSDEMESSDKTLALGSKTCQTLIRPMTLEELKIFHNAVYM